MSDAAAKPRYPTARPKVPPFARYRGTSAWHKSRVKMRAYAWFLAHEKRKAHAANPADATPAT